MIKFKEWNCTLQYGRYSNGRLCIRLVDDEGPVAVATVNIPERTLPHRCVFIKDYSENEGMAEALIEGGVIYAEPVFSVPSGFVSICAYELKPGIGE